MVTGLSHVSIAVPSLEHAATEIAAKLGLTMGKITANEEQGIRLAYVELGNARIEFMEPMHPTSPVAKFLERNPRGGIHHFCLAVDDVDAAVADMAKKGVTVIGGGKRQVNVHNERIAFIHPKDFLGALVEIEGQ